MRRSFISEATNEEEGAIDLTPMLDVVFIMLIFFIVTATFIKESGVEVNRPEASTANEKSDTTVLVAINSDNTIWIDKRRVDIRSVKANIQRLHAENPEGGVVIQADKTATVNTFTKGLDAAREVVGNSKVSLAVDGK